MVVDDMNCDHVGEATDRLGGRGIIIEISEFIGNTPHVLANEAIGFTDTDWICRLDVDDLLYPHAFNPLDGWAADVCGFGLSINGVTNLVPPRASTRDILASPHNLLFAASPFRREVWAETPGFLDIAYNDWAFWRACARIGATFATTGTIDYLYRQHNDSTTSRVRHDEEVQAMLRSEGQ